MSIKIISLILIEYLFSSFSAESSVEILDGTDLEQLSEYELKFLNDFVQRRGKGSVSRVPFNELMSERFEASRDSDIVAVGGKVCTNVKVYSRSINAYPLWWSLEMLNHRTTVLAIIFLLHYHHCISHQKVVEKSIDSVHCPTN